MCVEHSPQELHQRFCRLLHHALAQGGTPDERTGLGPRTRAAVARVAREHPEATVDLIADAYDAFHLEHG
jgi:hypothetical protein